MTTTETWSRLSELEQLAQWRSFLEALDAGDGGYHRYYPVLLPLWDRGEVPGAVDAERLAAREADMAEDARWAARHLPAYTPAERYRLYGSPPF